MSSNKLEVAALYSNPYTDQFTGMPTQYLNFEFDGTLSDLRHLGQTRVADTRDVRIDSKLEKGKSRVLNWRQWSAVSQEEIDEIAKRLGIEALDAGLLGANIVFKGIERFSQLPAGTLLIPEEKGPSLLVMAENKPCLGPGEEIAKEYSHVKASQFPKHALGLRGLVGMVYQPGVLAVGSAMRIGKLG